MKTKSAIHEESSKTQSAQAPGSSAVQAEGPAYARQRALQDAVDRSPRMAAQRQQLQRSFDESIAPVAQQKQNKTGMPDELKSQFENTLGSDLSAVRVHANSAKAPEVGALAYTQGSDIHFAPGQFKPDSAQGRGLLGHELGHVLQQQQGRVRPTTEVNGVAVNDDPGLEKEADDIGRKLAP